MPGVLTIAHPCPASRCGQTMTIDCEIPPGYAQLRRDVVTCPYCRTSSQVELPGPVLAVRKSRQREE